jgi:hypothetical protein
MDIIKQILELLRKPIDQNGAVTVKIMGLWSESSVAELLVSPEVQTNKFIYHRLVMLDKYFQDIYTNDCGDKSYLQPLVVQVLKQIIKVCKQPRIIKRFD